MFTEFEIFMPNCAKHIYTFAATGIKMRVREFMNRESAKNAMYKFMARHNLSLQEVYDDNHDKTYVCTNGVRFYIQRAR